MTSMLTRIPMSCRATLWVGLALVTWPLSVASQTPARGDSNHLHVQAPQFDLSLDRASQVVTALRPRTNPQLDFTPGDGFDRRTGDGFYHLGDLTLRLRTNPDSAWTHHSTAAARQPVEALEVAFPTLAAADLSPTLSPDFPLDAYRFWEVDGNTLVLRFELTNPTDAPIEIGALGIPMVFNNILDGRSLDEAHAVNTFSDPYIGQDAGYLQVTRLSGAGPALVVVPHGDTPFEAYNPLLDDPTRRGIPFEGFYEWMAHSLAYAETEWSDAEPWNLPTSVTLAPGESRSYGLAFLVSNTIREIESTLIAHHRPVAVGIPGYVLPIDMKAQLFLAPRGVDSLRVEPAGALTITETGTTPNGWTSYAVHGHRWGRARLTVTYTDGLSQTIHYKVIKPEAQVLTDLGRFLTTEQWFDDPTDPFVRAPSIISYDYANQRQVTEDHRVWIAGLSDEGGAGSWLAAFMKQLIQPDPAEVAMLERFVDETLWGGVQYADGDTPYGVRKSLFHYEPDTMPAGTYTDSVAYAGWSSWPESDGRSVVRSYNYPHVAAAYWVLYRLARDHDGLVTHHPWRWYLEQAYRTSEAMVDYAPQHAEFGQMEGTVFLRILLDLQRESWTEKAEALETTMRARAEHWRSQGYPFGSEMPWDSTGQEEVYAWCRYFGFDDKAQVTIDAILGYMPTVPHWGYNGSARRYWDFLFAGHPATSRVERQLHHYGSGLNAIPILSEYRRTPEDTYLLRVGYGGLMGSIANVTQDGFGPSAFHAFPSSLQIDGYSGDYGPNLFGHAINTSSYLVEHPEFGWLGFGGNVSTEGREVRLRPLDSAQSRVYVAPAELWLTLDAGQFETVAYSLDTGTVRITLAPSTPHTPTARLVVHPPAALDGIGTYTPARDLPMERGAYVLPLSPTATHLELRPDAP